MTLAQQLGIELPANCCFDCAEMLFIRTNQEAVNFAMSRLLRNHLIYEAQKQKMRYFFELIALAISLLILTINYHMSKKAEKGFFSEATLFLFSFMLLGIIFFFHATDFVFLYLAMELISLALYTLVASDKSSLKSVEAGLKYFILGSFSSLIYLLGCYFIIWVLWHC